jgi:PEP-CTERM motif
MPSFLPELTRRASGVLVVATLAVVSTVGAHAASVSGQGTWETTLQGRDLDGNAYNGYEAFYDTELDITWLDDSGYSSQQWIDANGFGHYMSWDAAVSWAANLNVHGITGWRLPIMMDTGVPGCEWRDVGGTDCGANVDTSSSELAHLYYVTLGNKSYFDAARNYQPDFGLQNTGPFSYMGPGPVGYWSGVEYAPDTRDAWVFIMDDGRQFNDSKTREFVAWAVRPGDVAAVPEPSAYALALAGLGVALWACGQRQR